MKDNVEVRGSIVDIKLIVDIVDDKVLVNNTIAIEESRQVIEKTDKRPTYVTGRDLSINPFSWSYTGICSHSNDIVSVR